MRRFKKITAVALSMAMMMSMVACGKDDGDSNKDDGNKTEVTTEKASDDNASSNDEKEDTEDADKTTADEATGDAVEATTEYDWTVTTEEAAEEDDTYQVSDGMELFSFDFEDNDLNGFTTYMNGGDYVLEAKDGQMISNIKATGDVAHGCQAYWDGFALLKGCVYTISFDISSDKERPIEWRVQLNGGDYHAYAGDIITATPDMQTISVDFTMEEDSDPAPRMVFNIGAVDGIDSAIGEHVISIDNLKLTVKDCSNATAVQSAPEPKKVKINQIGYAPDDTKIVVTSSPDDKKFRVIDAKTEEIVFEGDYAEAKNDVSMAQDVRVGDFSEVKTPGTYKIFSAPSGESYEFEIGDKLYADIYKDAVKMLYNQRCGVELDAGVAGDFIHGACHTEKALVYGSSDTKGIDVSGGWHDAGDYGRYVVPGAKTVQDLILAYEDYAADFDDIGIPESGNKIPDLLDEAKFELDWMLKMQDAESGGVYHKVSCLVFPDMVMPEKETDQLYLAPISYAATADFAAVMAKASVVYRQYDEEFADTCLEAAKKAFTYAEANFKDGEGYVNPEEIVTGEYPDKKLKDERIWAAAELYLATGDASYEKVVKEVIENDFQTGLGWAAIGSYALYDLAKSEATEKTIKETATKMLTDEADALIEVCKESAFGIDQGPSFVWGSNMRVANTACTLLMANKLSPKEEYVSYAERQRDYIFGVNGPTYCFVTGYGDIAPEHTHHRPSQALGKTMKGMLVGGADSALEDPYALSVLSGKAPAYAYVDNEQSYSCNEITIYWNSPLIYMMSGLE